MLAEFEALAENIKQRAHGRVIIYIPNPGNFGDGLIRYGTKLFLDDFGIEHREINIEYSGVFYRLAPYLLRPNRYFFVYGGGGAWSEGYSFGRDNCALIGRFTSNFMVLPSTYGLKDLPTNGVMYRRDKAESAEINPRAEFCHDMAFYAACRPRSTSRVFKEPLGRVGILMRTDKESRFPNSNLPASNVDISLIGNHMSNGDEFISRVSEFDTIYTDRLHVCVAGCIAGRSVKLIAGNYFKIRSIYEASIAPYFGDKVELLPQSFSPETGFEGIPGL